MQQDPVNLLFNLAKQVQLLSCLAWLGKTQVLACIPPSDHVAFEDIAETTGVPANKLARVVRLLATAGLLHEPRRGFVAHTELSLQFFQRPSLMDATLFMFNTMTPAALQMAETTSVDVSLQRTGLLSGYQERPALRRQMEAFHRLGLNRLEASITESLLSLDWQSLGQATVVQVEPPSPAIALALSERAPQLSLIIQSRRHPSEPLYSDGARARIDMRYREEGQRQTITDADVYILHLPAPPMISTSPSSKASITTELQVHFDLLRNNNKASLVIVALVLPDIGDCNAEAESTARLHDLTLLQLADEETMDITELKALIHSIGDANGKLDVVSKLPSTSCLCPVTLLETRIKPEIQQ